jgi:hypothetical protein
MRAPIMALLFAFEVTHDANALVPLLAACAVPQKRIPTRTGTNCISLSWGAMR